jgi:oligopeptide transport system ATP-binding protein
MAMSQVVVRAENLSVRFHMGGGVVYAVNGISFEVRERETVALVGESGCGKSVSMLSVMGLLPRPPAVVDGRVHFQGRDLLQLTNAEMQAIRGHKIAMIFQDPMTCLNPVLTIGYQIEEPLLKHLKMSGSEARRRAVELLGLVGLPSAEDRLEDYPHQFSGGMRQRVMIAMALACKPVLLIADEPTTALDVTIQAQIVELVKGLRDALGMSLIWITHDLGVVAGLADRVVVMYAGHVVEEADVVDLYARPLHPYTAALLRSIPSLDEGQGKKLQTIEGAPPDLLSLPPGCPFAPRCGFTARVCRDRMPCLREVDAGHRIACWVESRTTQASENRLAGARNSTKEAQ